MSTPLQNWKRIALRGLKALSFIATIVLVQGVVLRAKAVPLPPSNRDIATVAPQEQDIEVPLKSQSAGGLVKTQRSTRSSQASGSGAIPVGEQQPVGKCPRQPSRIRNQPGRCPIHGKRRA